jgi:putative DNA primase/helicase
MDNESTDNIQATEQKDTFTAAELLADIQSTNPDFKPDITLNEKGNIISLRMSPDISEYVPLTMTDIKAISVEAPEYVFYPCLPTQGIAFIYAASGLGKTLFTLNLSYAIAQGGSFLNYKCPKPRRVLYIDGEMRFHQMHSRLMQIAEHQGPLDFKDNLMIITPDKLKRRVPKIDDPYDQELYMLIMEKYEIEVVVFDNISMLSSIDENKSCEWKVIQDFLLRLKTAGKSVIVIHHAGKDATGYRGTSRMLDCVDVAISLQPAPEESLESDKIKGKKFKIFYQKAREFGGKDALPYQVMLDEGIWSTSSMEECETNKIIELYGLKLTQRDIAKDMGISLGKVNALIKKAKKLKLISD